MQTCNPNSNLTPSASSAISLRSGISFQLAGPGFGPGLVWARRTSFPRLPPALGSRPDQTGEKRYSPAECIGASNIGSKGILIQSMFRPCLPNAKISRCG